ncbi:MAG: nitroreductase family protein [Acidimicrobiia bacterium]|nr:nitroreductase family protein [Acidimicrobiia bacterium]
MEFSEVLAKRRMVRNYTDEPVSQEQLERIVHAGARAPSAGNTRGQSFVVVTDQATRRAIAQLAGEAQYVDMGFDPWVSKAPAHIIIGVSEDAYHSRYQEADKLGADGEIEWPVPYWWVDAGASMMAILLAAVDEGLAAGFLGVHAFDELEALVGMPSEVSAIGIATIGHPATDRRSGSLDRPSQVGVHWNHWTADE